MNPNSSWFCPLYQNEISAGRCLDINLERLGFFKNDALHEVMEATGKSELEVSATCETCPNQPLRGQDGKDVPMKVKCRRR
jgi:hypothetical protein